MRKELGPIDGREGTWWEVPQECNGLTEEHESCDCIHEYDNGNSGCRKGFYTGRITGIQRSSDECASDEWKDGDSDRGDKPDHLLEVRGERKVRRGIMTATGREGKQ